MKRHLCSFCCVLFPFFLAAQTTFTYDASGHRIQRSVIGLAPAPGGTDFEVDSASIFGSLASFEQMPSAQDLFKNVYSDTLNESDVFIYPNPTKGALAVEIRNKNPKISHHLTVYSLQGAIVFQKSDIGDYTPIDLSSQPAGIYLLRISSQESFVTWKIIKE
jgi:hypothetical protein